MSAGAMPSAGSPAQRAPDHARHKKRGFVLIIATFVALQVIALAVSWSAVEVVNVTRAYTTGEGRYSKAQKIAVLDLHRFAHSGAPHDYAAFLAATAIPLGDGAARAAMEESSPDLDVAASGLTRGGNHPGDIAGMIRLFRWLSWWRPFAAAVADWREGDRLVAELIDLGASIHERVGEGTLDTKTRATLLDAVDRIDERLTLIENSFTTHLGEAARMATMLVAVGLGITTLLLSAIGVGFALRLFRQQLRLDRQLGFSEQRFRDFAEVASDWYWEMDANSRVTYLSEQFQAATGIAPQDLLERDGGAYLRELADDGDEGEYVNALAARRAFRGLRLRHSREDGTVGYWSISGKPQFDESGQFLGFRGIGKNITTSVNDANLLVAAKERAELANRAKSDFLANMSHELRTPLNAILGFSEIIMNRQFGPDAIDRYALYAADINESGRHLLAVIGDILDLSKIEAGQLKLSESSVELSEIVNAARTLLGGRFEKASLDFRIVMPEVQPKLWVDERLIRQCLVNLLSNALKFTSRGGSVTLSATAETDGGLAIAVGDTGIGIAREHVAIVLAPFGQIESVFSRQHHGTGLGLPLTKSLIELHGGRLAIDSTPGAGTVVTLHLPRERVHWQPRLAATTIRAAG